MAKAKVLVVDDEPDVVKTVGMRLKSSGYDVITAMDGIDAVAAALKEIPDIIILDIGMPAGDGHSVARLLREYTQTRFTPIIFLTARTAEIDHKMALDTGASKYITKPFEPDELLAAVEELYISGRKRYA